jgi:hypothetical protein
MSITKSVSLFDYLPQIVMADDSPRARRSDPITSHTAADRANLTGSQSAVHGALSRHGGLAPFELEQILPLWSPSRIRTALTELAKQGLVERTDSTRVTPYGRDAHVWQVA